MDKSALDLELSPREKETALSALDRFRLDVIQTTVRKDAKNSNRTNKTKTISEREVLKKKAAELGVRKITLGVSKKSGYRNLRCSRDIRYNRCLDCNEEFGFATSWRCMDRLCPICAPRRTTALVKRLSEPLLNYAKINRLKMYLITITVRDTEHLPNYQKLHNAKRKFLKSEFWKYYGLNATVCSLETKIGSGSKMFHPHFHFIAFTREEIPTINSGEHKGEFELSVNDEMKRDWSKANKGMGNIVNGKIFDGNFIEVLKYMTDKNGTDMTDKQFVEFVRWSKGKRFFGMTGKLYGNKEFKALIEQAERDAEALEEETDETTGEVKEKEICCPNCGGKNYETLELSWRDGITGNYVLDKITEHREPDKVLELVEV
jgi:plasmid rolling circle replication initiator protein Rep